MTLAVVCDVGRRGVVVVIIHNYYGLRLRGINSRNINDLDVGCGVGRGLDVGVRLGGFFAASPAKMVGYPDAAVPNKVALVVVLGDVVKTVARESRDAAKYLDVNVFGHEHPRRSLCAAAKMVLTVVFLFEILGSEFIFGADERDLRCYCQ